MLHPNPWHEEIDTDRVEDLKGRVEENRLPISEMRVNNGYGGAKHPK